MSISGPRAQVAAVPYVREDRCLACWPCPARAVCKSKALIQIDRGDPPFIDAGRCFGCHTCVTVCPAEAIALRTDMEGES